MATQTQARKKEPARPEKRSDEFVVVASERGLGYNLPQKMGRALWGPMFLMGLMAFVVALILGIVNANDVATAPGDQVTIEQLRHVTAGVMFIGFMSVFSAITFAIARILGEFRKGGGEVQELLGGHVQTLKMPATAKGMILFMMMGMMILVVAVILHFVAAGTVVGASDAALLSSERWFVALEGVRRIGVAMHLFGIVLGLATIVHVLRFQSVRVRELADEHARRRQDG